MDFSTSLIFSISKYVPRSRDLVYTENRSTQCTQLGYLPTKLSLTQMLPSTQKDHIPPPVSHCTQSKCKAVLPAGYQYKTCEKCRNISRLSMQKKRKRDKTDEGQHHSPPIAPTPRDNDIEEDSDTELKNKVHKLFKFLKEDLPTNHLGNCPSYL